MAITKTQRLFDLTMRLALYVESVKLQFVGEFNLALKQVEIELKNLLSEINYSTLDGLSKSELNRLIFALRKSQLKIYSVYTEKLLKQLEEFVFVRLQLSTIVYASALHSFENNGEALEFSEDEALEFIKDHNESGDFAPLFGMAAILDANRLWGSIKNTPIHANGLYILPFISVFSKSAQAALENSLRKAYAGKLTVSQTVAALISDKSSQLNKIKQQGAAVLETTLSHSDELVSQALLSALFKNYQWVSIIDNSTTQYCIDHNGKVYKYGKGPIPPAHYKCRSKTIPLAALLEKFTLPTLYAWIKKQPKAFVDDLLGKGAYDDILNKKIGQKDFQVLRLAKALTVAQFKQKLRLITLA